MIAKIKFEDKKILINLFDIIINNNKLDYSYLNLKFNEKENNLILSTMDGHRTSAIFFKFNNIKITGNDIEEKSIDDFIIDEFIKELRKIKQKEVTLNFYEDRIEAVFDDIKKKLILLYSDEVFPLYLEKVFKESEKCKKFELDFKKFSELNEDLDSNTSLITFSFSKDYLEIEQSIEDLNIYFSVFFEKDIFIKYDDLNEKELIRGTYMYNNYIRYLPLFSALGIINTITFLIRSDNFPLRFHFHLENLDLDVDFFIASHMEEEELEGIPSKKTDQWILKRKAEALKLKLIRKSILGIYIIEEEQLDAILRKLKKDYISEKKLKEIEEQLEDLENLINLKLQPLTEKALKTFYIPF